MSDLFENIELQMQKDAKEKNPRSAILASQLETEKIFSKFIDENPNRVSIIEKEIKDVTDKYAFQYEVDPDLIYRETVSYLTKNAIMMDEPEEEMQGLLPGIRESLDLMRENGFNQLAEDWEERLSSMSPSNQADFYPEVIDSFIEAVQSSPQTEMWEMDPNQYNEWDKSSSWQEGYGNYNVPSQEQLMQRIEQLEKELANLKGDDEPYYANPFWPSTTHGEVRKGIEEELGDLKRRMSSTHKDLSDEELLNKIKEHVSQLKKLDEPMSEDLEALHQELWDRSGHGDKWRNRNKKEGEEKTAAGNYVSYQIKGNDHFLCPHCAHEMSGEDLDWENNLTGISSNEMADIIKYVGHSGKCDQCGMDFSGNQKKSAFFWDDWDLSGLEEQFPVGAENLPYGDDYESAFIREAIRRNMPILGRIHDLAMESGHDRLANDVKPHHLYNIANKKGIDGLNEYAADMARKLWEVLKGDRRPEQRSFYEQNKDELVNLITEANAIAYETNPMRVSQREASVAIFIGLEQAMIQKEAMEIYGGPIWDEIKERWKAAPGAGSGLFGGGVNYEIPGKGPGLGPQGAEIPGATWHDYLMRSNLYGNKPYPVRKDQEVDVEDGPKPPPPPDLTPTIVTGDRGTNVRITHFTPIEQRLLEVYMNKGLNEKYASIIVQSVGEMAQLQVDAPGLPVASEDPDSVNIEKEIGGPEGDKYRNINVEETSKAIGVEHQEPGPEFEEVREFIQPGGEAPYSDNDERTEKNKDKYKGEADRSKMDGKGVKQEDNAPTN